jgi:hypothetical protein
LLGMRLGVNNFQVETHAVLSFIWAAIVVRHDELRVLAFITLFQPGDPVCRDVEVIC